MKTYTLPVIMPLTFPSVGATLKEMSTNSDEVVYSQVELDR